MKAQSKSLPQTIQYDEKHIAVPINIVQITRDDETLYEYDLLIVLQGRDEVITAINAVQEMMDRKAQERGYDNIMSACTYAISGNQTFVAEGQACAMWRDAVWSACYQIMADVVSETRPEPALNELLAELPSMVWPE